MLSCVSAVRERKERKNFPIPELSYSSAGLRRKCYYRSS